MSRRKRRRHRHRDLAGSISTAVEHRGSPPNLRLVGCDGTTVEELAVMRAEQLTEARERWPLLWLDVEGLEDLAAVRMIGDVFEIGLLALEDAVTPDERPKVEAFGDQLLVAVRAARFDGESVSTDALGIFLGDRHVITFRQHAAEAPQAAAVLEGVRQRIRQGRVRLEHQAADHLCSLLLDAVVDGYFPVLERFGDRLETLEDEAINAPVRETLLRIHDIRGDLMTLRRALWPTRDVLHALGRETTAFVGEAARMHFRDCYDHTMELLDLMESYREVGSDLRDIYLASLSNRMNDVMKVLAVIATIFMPLTFITGWYGMNFDTDSPWNLPLTRYRYGAAAAAGIMFASTAGMVAFFWRRGWLNRWH